MCVNVTVIVLIVIVILFEVTCLINVWREKESPKSQEKDASFFLILQESRSSILRALAARQIKESVPCTLSGVM